MAKAARQVKAWGWPARVCNRLTLARLLHFNEAASGHGLLPLDELME